ncbi:MAG: polysaccharide biosynthesis tyrosine autokinase [Erysipelotrichia bacterium]|nr:polysaccharide biosynthesis tyrosine autokinase [Erysipelotrichia bacterium]
MKDMSIENMPELPFDVTESLNQLRVSLGFSGENIKTIEITSSTPNEGKSFVAMNLWKMMADVGNRVLLIDCDLRNSEMRSKWGLQTNEELVGIVHFLAAKADVYDIVYKTNIANGYIIPVAACVPNPTILLEGKRFGELLEVCKSQFDYILLDTPALGSVVDALKIATYCDGSLLVIRSGETPRKMVENSVSLLNRTETPLLGVVLNRADTSKRGNNYYYNHYYRYGYHGEYYGNNGNKKPK